MTVCMLSDLRLMQVEEHADWAELAFYQLNDDGSQGHLDHVQDAPELAGEVIQPYFCTSCRRQYDFYLDAVNHCDDLKENETWQ